MTENSRWDLHDADVAKYVDRSFDYIVDFLRRTDRSEPYAFDPSGDEVLRRAKRIRREALRSGGEGEVQTQADRHFGMPETSLRYSQGLDGPLYLPTRSASS
jgi:hypothetical protein